MKHINTLCVQNAVVQMLGPAGHVVYGISRIRAADARHTAHPAACEINMHNSRTEALFSSSDCITTDDTTG
jgi:hypothetical protein